MPHRPRTFILGVTKSNTDPDHLKGGSRKSKIGFRFSEILTTFCLLELFEGLLGKVRWPSQYCSHKTSSRIWRLSFRSGHKNASLRCNPSFHSIETLPQTLRRKIYHTLSFTFVFIILMRFDGKQMGRRFLQISSILFSY